MGIAGLVVSLLALAFSGLVCLISWWVLVQARRSADASVSSADAAKDSARAALDSVRSANCPDLVFEFVPRFNDDLKKLPNLSWGRDAMVHNRGKGPAVLLAVCGFDVEYGTPTSGVSLRGVKVAAGQTHLWRMARKALDTWPKSPDRDEERAGCVLFRDLLDNGYEQDLVWLPDEGRIEMRYLSSMPHWLFERFLAVALGPRAKRQLSTEETQTGDSGGQIQDGGAGRGEGGEGYGRPVL